MNVVGVQLDTVWEDKAANHAKLAALLAADPPEPGTLVVLPEMWATGFSMNVAAITETPDARDGGVHGGAGGSSTGSGCWAAW